jgi:hypothetical protein
MGSFSHANGQLNHWACWEQRMSCLNTLRATITFRIPSLGKARTLREARRRVSSRAGRRTKSLRFFRLTPYLVFVIPIFVTILIPVITDFSLVFEFMGDTLAGGFFVGSAGFFAALAAVDKEPLRADGGEQNQNGRLPRRTCGHDIFFLPCPSWRNRRCVISSNKSGLRMPANSSRRRTFCC